MKIYKLTAQDMTTYNDCHWQLGKWKKTSGKGHLCSSGWLHGYESAELAVLLNTIHADVRNPKLFIAEAAGSFKTDGLKLGVSRMRLAQEIKLPRFTTAQRVALAILVSYPFCKRALPSSESSAWARWADHWLDGSDRSQKAAMEAGTLAWEKGAMAGRKATAAATAATWGAKWATATAVMEAAVAVVEAMESAGDADFPMFLHICIEACKDF